MARTKSHPGTPAWAVAALHTGLLVGAALSLPTAAPAADLGGAPPRRYEPYYEPPAAAYPSWTGFYLGGTYGYASGATSVSGASGAFDADQSGGIGSLFAGYNFQAGRVVYGLEVDISGLATHDGSGGAGLTGVSSEYNWGASVRGRLGYLFSPDLLLYATGGIAWADFDITSNNFTVSQTFVGYQIGAGAEFAVARNWNLRLEYLYTGLGSETVDHGGGVINTYEPDYHTVRAGLSFRF